MERLGGVEARGIARRYWDGEATGEHDPVATAAAARRLAAALPGARLHAFPDDGHGIFREDPDRACALLGEFLTGNRVDADARVT